MTIKNVTIGDKFKNGKHIVCEVVDFVEKRSLTTGEVIGQPIVLAKGVNTFSTNTFEVLFTSVQIHKIK